MIADCDDSGRLTETVRLCNEKNNRLTIAGQGSKSFLDSHSSAEVLRTTDHTGVLEYEPDELVVTVRSGTSLSELRELLLEQGQMLPFDPPSYDGKGTVGGAMATGLSGPGRPWYGSLRDAVLGVEMVNGLGERLQFGGQVMKNVAGFDLSRLLVGSCGTLGLILNASLKVIPAPKSKVTVRADLNEEEASGCYRNILQRSNHVRGTFYHEGSMHVLLVDTESTSELGESFEPTSSIGSTFWDDIRDHRLDFFKEARHLWRIALPRGSRIPTSMQESSVEEWHGTLVWFADEEPPNDLLPDAQISDFRGRKALASPSAIVKRLRSGFDPNGIFANQLII